jgi:hypothetical protein
MGAIRIRSLCDMSFWIIVNKRLAPHLCRDFARIAGIGTSRKVVLELHAQGDEIGDAPSIGDVPGQQKPDFVLGIVTRVVEFQAQMPG